MSEIRMSRFWMEASGLALLVGGVGWLVVGLVGGWLGAAAVGLSDSQLRAAMHPFLLLLIHGLPGAYFALRQGPAWVLLAGTIVTALGLLLALLGSIAAFGLTGQGGDLGGELTLGIGTVVIGVGALVMVLGLIRQGGTADWVLVLLAALGLSVIPALLEGRLAILPGLCWAAFGFAVRVAAVENAPAPTTR